MGILNSPWLSLLTAGATGLGQLFANQEATAANQEVAGSASNLLNDMTGGALGYSGLTGYGTPQFSYDALGDIDQTYKGMFDLYNANANANVTDFNNMASGLRTANQAYGNTTQNAYAGMMGNILGEYDAGASGTLNYAQDRLKTGLGMYDQAAQQERRDLQNQYDASGRSAQQALASRGLGSVATIGTSVAAGNERERADALGRLNDRVTEMKAGAYRGLSGDVLSTIGQNAANRSNLYGGLQQGQYGLTQSNADLARQTESGLVADQYTLGQSNRGGYSDLYSSWANSRLGSNQTAAGNALNLLTGIENAYPDQSTYLNLLQGLGSGLATSQNLASIKRQQNSGLFGLGSGTGAEMGGALALGSTMLSGDPSYMLENYILGRSIGGLM